MENGVNVKVIKNFAELKRSLQNGTTFQVIDHWISDYIGLIREVNIVKTTGLYTKIHNEPDNKLSKVNGGRGSYMQLAKATHYTFAETVKWFENPVGTEHNKMLMEFRVIAQ